MRRFRGFTVVEMLVVVLILGVTMGIATSLFLNAQADARKKQCRMFMHTVGIMIDDWHYKHISGGARPYPTTLSQIGEVGPVPRCPSGGTYSWTEGKTKGVKNGIMTISCNATGHGSYVYGKATNE